MKNKIILPVTLLVLLFTFQHCNVKTLNALLGDQPLTESEVIQGLKRALSIGSEKTTDLLSKPGGYLNDAAIKILLPPEAIKVIDDLKKAPGGEQIYSNTIEPTVNDLVKALNSSAEEAAKDALPVFKDAITNMSISEAFAILKGDYKNAGSVSATRYFEDNTTTKLTDLYKPKINKALDKPLVSNQSANSIWNKFVTSYDKVVSSPANLVLKLQKVQEPDLSAYVTKKALDGMFSKVAIQEQDIRQNPTHYADNIIQRVFGSQKK
jgi:Protein of unknown function (DUF4197)